MAIEQPLMFVAIRGCFGIIGDLIYMRPFQPSP
jgi:hypothetical protein